MAGNKITSLGTGSTQSYADFKRLLDLDNNEFFKTKSTDLALTSKSSAVPFTSHAAQVPPVSPQQSNGNETAEKSSPPEVACDQNSIEAAAHPPNDVDEISLEWHGNGHLDDDLGTLANLMDRPSGVRMPHMDNFFEDDTTTPDEDDSNDKAGLRSIKSFVSEMLSNASDDSIVRTMAQRSAEMCDTISESDTSLQINAPDLRFLTVQQSEQATGLEMDTISTVSLENRSALNAATKLHDSAQGYSSTTEKMAFASHQNVDINLNPGEADQMDASETTVVRKQRQLEYVAVTSSTSQSGSESEESRAGGHDEVSVFTLEPSHNYDEVLVTERETPWKRSCLF
eukprot:m.508815 g.508815  ORF g.508815 m.508815 type:complete len:342 (+) comp21887_c1_seq2:201-1226(+)